MGVGGARGGICPSPRTDPQMIPLAPIQPTLSIVYILKISRKYDIFVSCIVDEVIQLAVSEGTAAQQFLL